MAITADRPTTPWEAPPPPGDPPQHSRRSYAIAAVIALAVGLIVVIVGVTFTHTTKHTTGSGSVPQVTAPGPSASVHLGGGPTPTIAPGTVPAALASPPSLAGAFVADPITVMNTLGPYIDWVFAHPDPALLDNYMLASSRTYSKIKAELATLAGNHWRQRPSVSLIQWIKTTSAFTPTPVHGLVNGHLSYSGGTVKVVIANTPESSDVLDSAGVVVNSVHNQPQVMVVIALAQGPDGQFRISDEVAFNPPGGVAAFES